MNLEDTKKKKKGIIIIVSIIVIVLLIFVWKEYLRFEFLKERKIYSYDETFEMIIPKGWEKTSKGKLNDDADIEIKNDSKGIYLIAVMDDIDDTSLTFQDYVDVIVYSIETGYKVNIPEVKSKNNYRYFSFEYKEGKENYYMCVYVVKTENYVGQIAIWSNSKNRDYVIESIDNGIIESIKEK